LISKKKDASLAPAPPPFTSGRWRGPDSDIEQSFSPIILSLKSEKSNSAARNDRPSPELSMKLDTGFVPFIEYRTWFCR
jgi:hypothetical protein